MKNCISGWLATSSSSSPLSSHSCSQFNERRESDFIGLAATGGESIRSHEGQAKAIAFALDHLVLVFNPDLAHIEIVIERLVGAKSD
jgi:hypothetical protein